MLKHRNTVNWSLIDKKWHEERNERIVKLAATLDAQKGGNSMSDKTAFAIRNEMFGSQTAKGFYMRFGNGYEISVQFGQVNGCDGGKTTAEVAVFDPKGQFVQLGENDDVLFNVTPERVAELIFEYSYSNNKQEETV